MIARQLKRIEDHFDKLEQDEKNNIESYLTPFLNYCEMLNTRAMQLNMTCFLMTASFPSATRFKRLKNLSSLPKQDLGIYRNVPDWAEALELLNCKSKYKMRTVPFLIAVANWFYLSDFAEEEKIKSSVNATFLELKSSLSGTNSFYSALLDRFEDVYL